ncbi:hypothetical protein T265_02948 [Opisthorchis viverrini]|uniref:Uncharacterized protein n=1 Tax=Opisthorchis viverrini TaxID=6198 RepID=A0A075A564_OPIVI|nr:hypothetical protein T265_02948 [Opisthorchis viverrini]KER30715.1 hypothetical protein T265_02948 [Opisthorchis viverrini]
MTTWYRMDSLVGHHVTPQSTCPKFPSSSVHLAVDQEYNKMSTGKEQIIGLCPGIREKRPVSSEAPESFSRSISGSTLPADKLRPVTSVWISARVKRRLLEFRAASCDKNGEVQTVVSRKSAKYEL